MEESEYDIAQICLNGCVINTTSTRMPEYNKDFCDTCGAATITSCQKCNAPIQGESEFEIISGPAFIAPAYCPDCGAPYPWTESRLQAARELTQELEGLIDDERSILAQNLDDIIAETPRTTLAATRWKRVLSRAGPVVIDAFREILIDVVSETAKKILWP